MHVMADYIDAKGLENVHTDELVSCITRRISQNKYLRACVLFFHSVAQSYMLLSHPHGHLGQRTVLDSVQDRTVLGYRALYQATTSCTRPSRGAPPAVRATRTGCGFSARGAWGRRSRRCCHGPSRPCPTSCAGPCYGGSRTPWTGRIAWPQTRRTTPTARSESGRALRSRTGPPAAGGCSPRLGRRRRR